MSSLSPQDRALVDAAIAAGRVTVVPRGASGIPLPVWDPKVGDLRYPEGADRMRVQIAAGYRSGPSGPRGSHPDIIARRERVAALHGQGLTVAQIVAQTGNPESLVRLDLSNLKLHAHRAQIVAAADRRDQVRALAANGQQTMAIAQALNLKPERVYRLGLQVGLRLDPPVDSVRRDKLKAFDDAVAALVAEGLTKGQIRVRLDVSAARVRESMRRQDLKAPNSTTAGPSRQAKRDARAAEIRRLAGEGMTRLQIAEALGVRADTVRDIGKVYGIDVPTGKPGAGRPVGPARGFSARPGSRPRPAEETRQRVAALYGDGLSWRQIADQTGLTIGTVGYHLKMLGIVKARVRDAKVLEKAAELRAVGASARMVAEVLGVGVVKARAILREAEALAQKVAA